MENAEVGSAHFAHRHMQGYWKYANNHLIEEINRVTRSTANMSMKGD